MSKYIDADALSESVNEMMERHSSGKAMKSACLFTMTMLVSAPAADVAPVRHGTWKPDFCKYPSPYSTGTELHCDGVICSLCGCGVSTASAYCPHCGAKMDVETP